MTKIEMEKEIIELDKIDIRSDCTIFCSVTRQEFPIIEELEKQVKELRKELKENEVSLGKTDTLKILKEKKKEYSEMVKQYNNTFDKLVVGWYNKMQVEGMHTGYRDDTYYYETLLPLNHSLTKMSYRNSILSTIKDIQIKVRDLKNDIKFNNKEGKGKLEKVWL